MVGNPTIAAVFSRYLSMVWAFCAPSLCESGRERSMGARDSVFFGFALFGNIGELAEEQSAKDAE